MYTSLNGNPAAYPADNRSVPVNFLRLYRQAKEGSFTVSNIQSAWASSGLLPFDPAQTIKKIKKPSIDQPLPINLHISWRPTTPPEQAIMPEANTVAVFSDQKGRVQEILLSPQNADEINASINRAFENPHLLEATLKKIGDAAKKSQAKIILQLAHIDDM